MSDSCEVEYQTTVMVSGEPFTVYFEYFQNDETTPFPLTGYTFKAQLRKQKPFNGEVIEEWTELSPEVNINELGGVVTLSIPGSETLAYEFITGYLDGLIQKDPDGVRSLTLRIELDSGVTRG